MAQKSEHEFLKKIDLNRLDAVEAIPADAKALLEGNPRFRTSVQDRSDDGTIEAGVWEATPGMTRSVKGEKTEFCWIVSGLVELTQDGAAPQVFGAGDGCVMKPGFTGTWRTLETVRKFFVIVDPGSGGTIR